MLEKDQWYIDFDILMYWMFYKEMFRNEKLITIIEYGYKFELCINGIFMHLYTCIFYNSSSDYSYLTLLCRKWTMEAN